MAAVAGWEAARSTFADPQGIVGMSSRAEYYDRLWAYYTNTAYAEWGSLAAQWEALRGKKGFYRYHRTFMNPTYRVVKFYRDSIYKGPLSLDGENLPDGTQIAIPFGEDTEKSLKLAVAQIWEWSGWQQNMLRLTTNTPALGNVLAEVLDLPWQGKVVIKLWKPQYVKDIVLDDAGNPKYYCIEYKIVEQNRETKQKREYLYRRETDARGMRTFMNGEPYDYSNGITGPAWEHPYGFAPARWFRHMVDELDSDYGVPAIYPALDKIDELNELVSQGHDQLGKIFNAPIIIKGGNRPTEGPAKRGASSVRDSTDRTDKEKINYVYVGSDGGAETIQLSMSEALEWVQNGYQEIEADLPELGFPRRLSEMSTLTGPGAQRVLRDVVDAHLSIQANYDHETRRLMQMAVAIAGWNYKNKVWQRFMPPGQGLNAQQERFALYDLESYKAGNLNFTIVPRPLIVATDMEKYQSELAQTQAADVKMNNLSIPKEEVWEELEYPPEKISKWLAAEEEKQAQNQAAMAALQQANAQAQQNGEQAPGADKGAPGQPPQLQGGAGQNQQPPQLQGNKP